MSVDRQIINFSSVIIMFPEVCATVLLADGSFSLNVTSLTRRAHHFGLNTSEIAIFPCESSSHKVEAHFRYLHAQLLETWGKRKGSKSGL